jgi:hypothetical protein
MFHLLERTWWQISPTSYRQGTVITLVFGMLSNIG